MCSCTNIAKVHDCSYAGWQHACYATTAVIAKGLQPQLTCAMQMSVMQCTDISSIIVVVQQKPQHCSRHGEHMHLPSTTNAPAPSLAAHRWKTGKYTRILYCFFVAHAVGTARWVCCSKCRQATSYMYMYVSRKVYSCRRKRQRNYAFAASQLALNLAVHGPANASMTAHCKHTCAPSSL